MRATTLISCFFSWVVQIEIRAQHRLFLLPKFLAFFHAAEHPFFPFEKGSTNNDFAS